MSSYTISSLIEKLDARDKDERFMAMHDLSQDLDRDNIRLDGEMERRVVAMILKHLEDPGTDVKQQAVRTIASLARKVKRVDPPPQPASCAEREPRVAHMPSLPGVFADCAQAVEASRPPSPTP